MKFSIIFLSNQNSKPGEIFYEGDYSHVCYCENKNGEMLNNGIICGYEGEEFSKNGDCLDGLVCVGPTKEGPASQRVPSFRRQELCSKGSV